MMTNDKRRHVRFTVVDLELINQDTQERIGKIVNLSEGGLLVVSDQPLDIYSTHNFRIPFDQTINGKIHFDFEASVVWCNQNTEDHTKYSVGMKFTESPALQTLFVLKMIKAYGS